MKLSSAIILASLAGASAFTSPVAKTQSFASSLRVSDVTPVEEPEESPDSLMGVPEIMMSQSLPFMERPAMLDGSMVGDVGFDPVGFAKSKADLMSYREAEIKHGRLAMLAAAGWPLSELFDKKLAGLIDMAPLVDAQDRAPSLLNGGLGKVSPVYWIAVLLFAGAVDVYGIKKSKQPGYTPGDLGFDPLGLYSKDVAGQEAMQLKELKNGRLGMIAVTAFAFQEFVTKLGVVDETPAFFKPIGSVLHEYTNTGYTLH
jgi:hypothetical protein